MTTHEPITGFYNYLAPTRAFLYTVIGDMYDNGHQGDFTVDDLLPILAQRWDRTIEHNELRYLKRNLAQLAADPQLNLIRSGHARSGVYRLLRGMTRAEIAKAKANQPRAVHQSTKAALPPPPVEAPPPLVRISEKLEVLDTKDDVALLRSSDTGHIFRVALERLVL